MSHPQPADVARLDILVTGRFIYGQLAVAAPRLNPSFASSG
jgi:hypothetical protein